MATPESRYLTELGRRVFAPYAAWPQLRAALLTGSVVGGYADSFSDLDLILYHEQLPPEEVLRQACQDNGGEAFRIHGDPQGDSFMETYKVEGVVCQYGHTTVAAWEQGMASVLDELDVASPLQKAFIGVLDSLPLYGDELIAQWQQRLRAYPEPLARAMVEQHLDIFPLWYVQDSLIERDAVLWSRETQAENARKLLAILAGLNRVYFSPFQFKRLAAFAQDLPHAPPNLAQRLDRLCSEALPHSGLVLEELVAETAALIETHMPEVDATALTRLVGQRHESWTVPEDWADSSN